MRLDQASQDIKKTAPKKKGFRLQSRGLFLTYPQCPLEKDVVLQALKDKLASKEIKHIIVCREEHETEGSHLHAYVRLEQKVDFSNARCRRRFEERQVTGSWLHARGKIE